MYKRQVYVRKEKTGETAISAVPLIFCASMTVSRVLYLTVIYLDVPLPVRSSHPGSGRASLGTRSPCSHTGVAPDRVYSIGHSRADGCALTAPFHPYLRYLHTSGGLFLLHFSSDRSGRALPVILALWSPDFPHGRAFRPFRATVCFPRGSIVRKTAGKVNGKSINKRGSVPCPWRRSW